MQDVNLFNLDLCSNFCLVDVAAESMRKQVWAIINKTADLVTGNKTLDLSDEVNSPLLSEKSEPKKTK